MNFQTDDKQLISRSFLQSHVIVENEVPKSKLFPIITYPSYFHYY